MQEAKTETLGRLVAKLTWELLTTRGPYESVAELTLDVKRRCERLHIAWTNDAINDAYRLIESNTPLCRYVRPSAPSAPVDRVIAAGDAAALADRIRRRLGVELAPKAIPAVRPLTDDELGARRRRDDQRRAYLQVKRLIVETARRVARLEREIEP